LSSLQRVDPGFDPEGIVDVTIDFGLTGERVDSRTAFAAILENAAAIPGVESATMTAVVPLSGSNMETRVLPLGRTIASRRDAPSTYFHVVAPRYFETMRIPLQRGREFTPSDRDGAPRVAVINETAARRLWPEGDAVGKRFHWGAADGEILEVVGIARDADYVMPGEDPKTVVYVPFAQEPLPLMFILARVAGDPRDMEGALQRAVARVDDGLGLANVRSLSELTDRATSRHRALATVLSVFAGLALGLAMLGLYASLAYVVAQRRREIAIRVAVGATVWSIRSLVAREGVALVGAGLVLGVVLSLALTRLLASQLYGVTPTDPGTFAGIVTLLCISAVGAALAPIRQAMRVDPAEILRSE